MRLIKLMLTFTILSQTSFAQLDLNKIPSEVELSSGDSSWSSRSLKNKVHLLIYSNTSSKNLNEQATDAVKEKKFPRDQFASVAVVNMKDSWQPNFLINRAIAEKAKQYKDTIYVKDFDRTLVKAWDLKGDSNDILVFDKQGKLVYNKNGKLSKEDTVKLLSIISSNIEPKASS